MASNGSMMSGALILLRTHGPNSTALGTYLLREKGMLRPWWMMLCTSLEGEPRRGQTSEIWPPSESPPGDGTHSRIWVHHRLPDLATA
jgi:hypothetical protein